jgi:nitrous oxidase accessory protein NosD
MSKAALISYAVILAVALVAVTVTMSVLRPGGSDTRGAGEPATTPDGEAKIGRLIDEASPGDTVRVPGNRVYRETVVIDKPITLVAEEGAEVRGSDVWEGWQSGGGLWRSEKTYPSLQIESRWRCEEGTGEKCKRPEQVFIDGEPLEQVRFNPGEGEFTLDRDRRVLLGEDPAGSIVEVTVRDRWVVGRSDGVTIRGFKMRHSAGQGIKNDRYDDWRVIGNDLAYAHTVNVELSKGAGMVIEDNEIYQAGQLGVASNAASVVIRGNEIHHNNTADFKTGWEAGGMKISATVDSLVEDNEVFENDDIGIWTDVATTGPQKIVIRDNQVYDHPRQGIRVEISKNAEIKNNVVYGNGSGYPLDELSGAGITLSGTYNARVSDNVLAYNSNGLVVVNEDREKGFDTVKNVLLSSNDVIQQEGVAAAWMKAYSGGDIYDVVSGNGGQDNRYYYPGSAGGESRYKWERYYENLSAYNETPAEYNGSRLSESEKNEVLEERGLPIRQER